jgi:transposase
MQQIPKKVSAKLEEMKKQEGAYLEVKLISGGWYVYKSTSQWNKERKKVQKIYQYLGSIDDDGRFKARKERSFSVQSTRDIYEYGNCTLARHFLSDAESALSNFTIHSKELIAAAIVKSIDPKPLRLLESRWEKFHLSQEMKVDLNPKSMSLILREIGEDVSTWRQLFELLTPKDDILLYDLTSILTYSQNIRLAEKGYNPNHEYLKQIGIALAFSTTDHLPVGMEIYPGSVRDVKTIKDFVNRYSDRKIGFIFDRGFSAYSLLKDFRNHNMDYVVPLKRNSKFMKDLPESWIGAFQFRERFLRWTKEENELGFLYRFDDSTLRGEQEQTLLKRGISKKTKMAEYEEKRKGAGIIPIVSTLNIEGAKLFEMYKGREDVELAFDALKNDLESDKTYLQSSEGVRGYFFVSFLALRVYFSILKRLREKSLTNKISVEEVLFELSKVYKIVDRKISRDYFASIPKRAESMIRLFPEAFTMG